jgi:hypothetical protein
MAMNQNKALPNGEKDAIPLLENLSIATNDIAMIA